MTVSDIYEKYEIPPNLADHQLAVAAVARIICNKTGKGNEQEVVAACLLHDMGNIIKFKFDKQLPGVQMENVEHWKEVQRRFVKTYGGDVHVATMEIVRDIGVSERTLQIIDSIGFTHSVDTLRSGDISMMIAAYSDMRVAPWGIVPLEQRLSDLAERYGFSPEREQYNEAFRKMELIIFNDQDIEPSIVSQDLVNEAKNELKEFFI